MKQDVPEGLDPAIASYYERSPEETRLLRGVYRVEAERTREILTRFAPPPPATVLDVGGGAGAYSLWLAARGYTVHLIDAVSRLVEVARREAETAGLTLASAKVGDARNLEVASGSADCVLLLGPLYHLPERTDRHRVLTEAVRVLRPNGVLVAACITRWAPILDGIAHDYLADPDFVSIMEADLESGQHRNPTGDLNYFTTAYFHTPEEFRAELQTTGMEVIGLYGLEGPAVLLGDLDERWSDPRMRTDVIRVARQLESVPSLLGLSPHVLGVARKSDT